MRDQLNGQADAFSKRLAEELSGLVKSLDAITISFSNQVSIASMN